MTSREKVEKKKKASERVKDEPHGEDASSSGDSVESDDEKTKVQSGKKRNQHGSFGELERMRREMRLATNRESARARRKKKKEHLISLQKRIERLEQQNRSLELTNEVLRNQILGLEAELAIERAKIMRLARDHSMALPATSRASQVGLPSQDLASIVLAQRATNLQRQALSGASATDGERTKQASGLSGPSGIPEVTGGSLTERQLPPASLSRLPGTPGFSLAQNQSVIDYLRLLSSKKKQEASVVQHVAQQASDTCGLFEDEKSGGKLPKFK